MVSISLVLFLVIDLSVILCENKSNNTSFEYNIISALKTSDGVLVLFTIRSDVDPMEVFWSAMYIILVL